MLKPTTLLRIAVLFSLVCAACLEAQDRAAWMKAAKWGVMTHYLSDWQAKSHNLNMTVDEWNKLVDNFDAEGIADQLQSAGASYYQISIGQNSGYYLAPNPVYD
jgi:hypothetical protein